MNRKLLMLDKVLLLQKNHRRNLRARYRLQFVYIVYIVDKVTSVALRVSVDAYGRGLETRRMNDASLVSLAAKVESR